jgi:hypothetical protein
MSAIKENFDRECFIVMPLGTKGSETAARFSEIYSYLIKPAVEETGFSCVRADEILKPGSIIQDIVAHLTNSIAVIADLTGQNPNVFYEVGVRDAVKGRMILLAQDIADVPFDLRGYRVVVYEVKGPKGYHEAKEKIRTYLKELEADKELKGSTVRDYLFQEGLEQLTAVPQISDHERGLTVLVRDLHTVVSNIQSTNAHLLAGLDEFGKTVEIGRTLSESMATSLRVLGPEFPDRVIRKLSEVGEAVERIGKREDVSKLTEEFGLEGVHRNRLDAIEHEFYRIMENERKQIDIVGSTIFGLKGHSWVTPERVVHVLRTKKADPNFVLRILLTHHEYLSFRQEQERKEKRPDRWVISKEAIDAVDILRKADMLDCVRFYRGAPTCFTIVCHGQERMLLNPYPYEREAFNSWCLVIRNVPAGIYNEFLISHVDKPWVNELLAEPYSKHYQEALEAKYQKDLDAFFAETRGKRKEGA